MKRSDTMGRLGMPFDQCGHCGGEFALRYPRHCVFLVVDGEIADNPEDLPLWYCSHECGEAAANQYNAGSDEHHRAMYHPVE